MESFACEEPSAKRCKSSDNDETQNVPAKKSKFIYCNEELNVITKVDENGEPWMVANPFADALNYSNVNRAIRIHVSECNVKNFEYFRSLRGSIRDANDSLFSLHPKTKFINKAGLLELVLKSRMRYAAEFRYWLVNELFPSLKINALDDFEMWRVDPKNKQTLMQQLPKDDQLGSGACVYVITNDLYEPLHLYKIGYTYNLDDRLSELNVASAYDFRPVLVIPTKQCRQLETFLHSKYKEQRIRREFFKLNDKYLNDLIVICSHFYIPKIYKESAIKMRVL
ncbi:BRO [Pseudalatia unipuncta granulovirus]|uniref:BRO n=1 Tax=Pseudalatia unipuncta granulosis virus TaxID=36355 RepID=B6S731_GVPU|nr:BRO [Pseudalatia unipuncta granulovirus]ACH69512.1 BRO [Pseudalatia unipuncta granulovirus]